MRREVRIGQFWRNKYHGNANAYITQILHSHGHLDGERINAIFAFDVDMPNMSLLSDGHSYYPIFEDAWEFVSESISELTNKLVPVISKPDVPEEYELRGRIVYLEQQLAELRTNLGSLKEGSTVEERLAQLEALALTRLYGSI